MNIEKFDFITLDDNKRYVVGSIIKHNDITYYLLCDEQDPNKYMFCHSEDIKLVKVEDEELIKLLSLKVSKDLLS